MLAAQFAGFPAGIGATAPPKRAKSGGTPPTRAPSGNIARALRLERLEMARDAGK